MPPNLQPTVCNLCGGKVVYTPNTAVYHGRRYGSGWCYLCTECGAYVGTHRPRPREALGLLADERMRRGKILCHQLFDARWQGKPKANKKRSDLYRWLAWRMGIPVEECHFGYFDLEQLRTTYKILYSVKDQPIRYGPGGRIIN